MNKMTEPILHIKSLSKRFNNKEHGDILAVEDVSFSIMPGECVGLVGESGSGKSTIAKIITHLLEPTEGLIEIDGKDVTCLRDSEVRLLAKSVQMVFQNPAQSFNPRKTFGHAIAESMRNFGETKSRATEQAVKLLEQCELPSDFMRRYPREASGGQCQRAAIARALALNPSLIVLDEATSELDITVQAQIIKLLQRIRETNKTAYLFICHDIALAQSFCDRLLIMQAGRIVEEGKALEVTTNPKHEYTKQLLDAVMELNRRIPKSITEKIG